MRLDCCPSSDLGGEEGRAADRAFTMLAPPLGGGRVPQLKTALRQFGRHEDAELCEAAAGGPGSGMFKGCQGRFEGSLELKRSRAVRGPTTPNHNFKLPNLPLRLKRA